MISIRALRPSEWLLFREFRLAALRASPGVFLGTFEREAAHTQERWAALLAGIDGAVFGLFEGTEVIGITSVYTDQDDPNGSTAGLAMSFILPAYRGRGLSAKLYEARLAWIRSRPKFRRVRVGHRASNEASMRAVQRHGFALIDRKRRLWPDGGQEDELIYELWLG